MVIMKKDLYVPQEICRNILERLPIRSIIRCKSVCKSWRDMIQGKVGEFAISYTPKPCLAYVHPDMRGYTVCDEAFQPLFRFSLPPQNAIFDYHRVIIGSINGLILLWDGFDDNHHNLFTVNPMTCEYIELPHLHARRPIFGFGVSKLSGQYKILSVDESRSSHVYTLSRGGGLWRCIPTATTTVLPCDARLNRRPTTGMPFGYVSFLNGNLHWLAIDCKNNILVSCFDLETELFANFSPPPFYDGYSSDLYGSYQLCILDDRLCFCDNMSDIFCIYLDDGRIWRTKFLDNDVFLLRSTNTKCL